MKPKSVKIDDLYINEENPRDEPQENEEGAIKILLNEERKFFNLMKSIAKYGFEISERIIIIEADIPQKYKIMDGNRRISCIKLLNNPDFLPRDIGERDRLLKRIKKIANDNNYNPIYEVESVLYDIPAEEESMKRTIQNKHTGENDGTGRLQWNYKAQSRFKNDDYKIYLVDFLDNILKVERSFSTMERIFGDPDMRILLGIIINKNKPEIQLVNNDSLKKIYFILYLIKSKQINVSDVYYKGDRQEFYNKYFKDDESWKSVKLPISPILKSNEASGEGQDKDSSSVSGEGQDKDSSSVSGEGQDKDSQQEPADEQYHNNRGPRLEYREDNNIQNDNETKLLQPEPTDKKKQSKPESSSFLFQGIIYTGRHPGISRALYELHRLRISTHSLSATYLTRTLLECTLQEYLVENQLFGKWKKTEIDPSITDLLKYCVNNKTFLSINRNYQRTITTAFSKKDHDELNSISHGKYNLPSVDILWDIERRWKLFLQHMIEDLNNKIQ
ncbi:hypothetical protein HF695_18395 [Bacillus safensis]|uniref:hypothetical protein n=1 Tax=Bacillus safensis TaxID=561879 RepID=UPI001BA6EACF|nr:hypothetical protein [Bacillus safensis]MBR0604293.1 hypothetical protein [Bacillus safensis]